MQKQRHRVHMFEWSTSNVRCAVLFCDSILTTKKSQYYRAEKKRLDKHIRRVRFFSKWAFFCTTIFIAFLHRLYIVHCTCIALNCHIKKMTQQSDEHCGSTRTWYILPSIYKKKTNDPISWTAFLHPSTFKFFILLGVLADIYSLLSSLSLKWSLRIHVSHRLKNLQNKSLSLSSHFSERKLSIKRTENEYIQNTQEKKNYAHH